MTGASDRGSDGYRRVPGAGPALRTDIIDVYVFRRSPESGVEFLQLRRARPPLAGDWHPLMGHIDAPETAAACALRELGEEVGLSSEDPDFVGFWQLEQLHPYFLAELDCVVLSPRFAAEVSMEWAPRLNDEHDDARWAPADRIEERFVWPGQKRACREVLNEIVRADSLAASRLRLRHRSTKAGPS